MTNKLNRLAAAIVGSGMMFAMFLVAMPAQAATAHIIALEPNNTSSFGVGVDYVDSGVAEFAFIIVSYSGITDYDSLISAVETSVATYAGNHSITLDEMVWPFFDKAQVQSLVGSATSSLATVATTGSYEDLTNKPTIPGVATSSSLALSLQTSTGAVGTQVSTTSGAWVAVAGQVSTTASIAGNASGDIIVEVAPTNSATAGDWVEWGRIGNSQALSLAITLQSVQVVKGQVLVWVPQGWYVKARQSGSGTVSYQLNTVKKITQ